MTPVETTVVVAGVLMLATGLISYTIGWYAGLRAGPDIPVDIGSASGDTSESLDDAGQ